MIRGQNYIHSTKSKSIIRYMSVHGVIILQAVSYARPCEIGVLKSFQLQHKYSHCRIKMAKPSGENLPEDRNISTVLSEARLPGFYFSKS